MQILQLTYTDSLPVLTSHRSPFLTIWRRPRETVRWIVAENPSLHVMWLACLAGIGDSLSRDFARDTGRQVHGGHHRCDLGGMYSGAALGTAEFLDLLPSNPVDRWLDWWQSHSRTSQGRDGLGIGANCLWCAAVDSSSR